MITMRQQDLYDATKRLDPMYQSQIRRAGPVLAVLHLGAHLLAVQSPPSPSPVAAHLLTAEFTTWPDVNRHLKKLRPEGSRIMGPQVYDAWSNRITQLCKDPYLLLAYTMPLLIEGQMGAIAPAPNPAQDVLLAFLAPILGSDAPLRTDPSASPPRAPQNASIFAVLHAGKVPFVLACHDSMTVTRWRDHLEAATILLLPQLTVEAEITLPEVQKRVMRQALVDELRSWRVSRPSIGRPREWPWLPKLV
jgi:hypothetical protein